MFLSIEGLSKKKLIVMTTDQLLCDVRKRISAVPLLSNFEAVLHILFGIFLTLWTNEFNFSRDSQSFFNRRGLWRCYRYCLSCFLLFGQRASACTFDHLFVRLPSLCLEVCLSFVICLNISLLFIQLLLFELGTSVSHSNEMYQNIPRAESPFTCNQNIKEDISIELEVLIAFKRNETKFKLIFHENIHATRE